MAEERSPLIAANWKSNTAWSDCEQFVMQLRELAAEYFAAQAEPPVDMLICPPIQNPDTDIQ